MNPPRIDAKWLRQLKQDARLAQNREGQLVWMSPVVIIVKTTKRKGSKSVKKEIHCIYIRTTIGHVSSHREIEESVLGFCRAYSYAI